MSLPPLTEEDKVYTIKYHKPEDAPKDRVFLAFFNNWPFCTTVNWCGPSKNWVAAIFQLGLFEGNWDDAYFENEHFETKDMIKWCELPGNK